MKKILRVQIEKEYDIDIDDSILTPEFVKEFESYMFELDGITLEQKYADLFKFAARQLAQGEDSFIEGLGAISNVFSVDYKRKNGRVVNVVWKETEEWTDVEVVE
jgi:hypothetical protein